ncbi:3-hydroxypropanoate dehydrogenase [Klenkia marina]|uniref:3-hydroxypropanoate dehydrogenase n=1 Tax=Klenkia marina TaxID=1960309 RepID=A0A1G4YKV8_9ACTN|nr:malonic semialdehyde reductase [Klenkia marina]SCX54130.1 3-hydroxypropanoate dehydrogenase [Klenkia marina]
MTTTEAAPAPQLDAQGRKLLFTEARTANSFSDTKVADAQLDAIWELAKWAPSSMNSQPLRVTWIRSSEGKERVARHLMEPNRAKTLSAPVVALLAYEPNFAEHFTTTFPERAEMYSGFFASLPPEHVDAAARYNAAVQTGVFILAIRAQGLAAGPMTGFDPVGMDAEFFAQTGWRSHAVVNIGHPGANAWFDRLPRVPDATAVSWA